MKALGGVKHDWSGAWPQEKPAQPSAPPRHLAVGGRIGLGRPLAKPSADAAHAAGATDAEHAEPAERRRSRDSNGSA
jgi:hypothetical protein